MRDPTHTIRLRSKANGEIDRRFYNIRKSVEKNLKYVFITNAENYNNVIIKVIKDPEKFNQFIKLIKKIINKELVGRRKRNWFNKYTKESYNRGVNSTRNILNQFFSGLFIGKITKKHIERTELIFTRNFNQLKGISDGTAQRISRVLGDGMLNGFSPSVIARNIFKEVKIGRVRTKLLARTEIVNTHNVASLIELDSVSDFTGENIKVRWITALDGRERETHRRRHNKIYSRKEAYTLIGEPNCRCSVTPYIRK